MGERYRWRDWAEDVAKRIITVEKACLQLTDVVVKQNARINDLEASNQRRQQIEMIEMVEKYKNK